MRALTVKQPWAFAIVHLGKDVENRNWEPPRRILGQRIAIHAGKSFDHDGLQWIREMLQNDGDSALLKKLETARFERGAIIGTSILGGWAAEMGGGAIRFVTPAPDRGYGRRLVGSRWAAREQYQWEMARVEALPEPVFCRGALSLWTIPEDSMRQLSAMIK